MINFLPISHVNGMSYSWIIAMSALEILHRSKLGVTHNQHPSYNEWNDCHCYRHRHTSTRLKPVPRLNIKTVFPGMGISIIKVRWSWDHLIIIMGIPTPKDDIYIEMGPGRLNIKMPSYQYEDSHVKDKMVLSLTWESPYLGKTVFILRRGSGSWRSAAQCSTNLAAGNSPCHFK